MQYLRALAIVVLIHASLAIASHITMSFTPKRTHDWYIIRDADNTSPLKLTFALHENNYNVIEHLALEISDPKSPRYGKHLTFEDLVALTSPDEAQVSQLIDWIRSFGVDSVEVSGSKGFIHVETSVEVAEQMVKCDIVEYGHPQKDSVILRCQDDYHIKAEYASLVDFIAPLHGFPKQKRVLGNSFANPVNVSTIYSYYGLPEPTDLKVNSTQAVWEEQDSYSNADLTQFFQTYIPQLASQTVVKTLGDTPNDPSNADDEASLDIQMIMSVGAYAPSYSYNYEEDDVMAAFLHWVQDVSSDPKPILVHSVSYGEYGGEYPIGMVDRISNEWMKLGTRGVTVLVASGDDGVGCNDNCTGFEFPYPSSPWITLVGSTQLDSDNHNKLYENGSFFSSGGFSNDFGIPKWQAAQVEYYLKNCPDLPTSTFYNASGRALPDVAAFGENVMIILYGSETPVSGTSCSAPIWAGLVTIMNANRMKAGKSPMGFINPVLYQAYADDPTIYNDIIYGNNADDCCPGFNAYKGWDPVTGLGTPVFSKLLKYVVQLP